MSYKEITSAEEGLKRYKAPIDISKMKDALSYLPAEISRGMIALAVLQIMVWVVNNDDPAVPEWLPDYNDTDQEKWYPWYTGGAPDGSGSGWSFYASYYGWTRAIANGGARLALKDEERADHMNEYFEEWYKDLWLILTT